MIFKKRVCSNLLSSSFTSCRPNLQCFCQTSRKLRSKSPSLKWRSYSKISWIWILIVPKNVFYNFFNYMCVLMCPASVLRPVVQIISASAKPPDNSVLTLPPRNGEAAAGLPWTGRDLPLRDIPAQERAGGGLGLFIQLRTNRYLWRYALFMQLFLYKDDPIILSFTVLEYSTVDGVK